MQLKDAGGVDLVAGGDSVLLGTDLGALSLVLDNGDGTYTATLTSNAAGLATITGTVNAGAITDDTTVTSRPSRRRPLRRTHRRRPAHRR